MNQLKRVFFVGLLLLSIGLVAGVMSSDSQAPLYDKYKSDWRRVDSLEQVGLTKQALEMVRKIYAKARKADNQPQVVKSLLHIMKFESYTTEDEYVKYFADMEQEIARSSGALKAILHSVTAGLYQGYYQQNQWAIRERTVVDDSAGYDVRGWDKNRFDQAIRSHFDASLADAAILQKIPIETFEDILITRDVSSKLQPTLYCFLAGRALEYYAGNDSGNLASEAEKGSEMVFYPLNDFLMYPIPATDGWKALWLYKELLQFYRNAGHSAALIHADINRISYGYSLSVAENKESLYRQALQHILTQNTQPEAAYAGYLLANSYRLSGDKYSPLNESEQYKNDYQQSIQICRETIQKFPGSIGANNCEVLIHSLQAKSLSLQLESVYIPEREDLFQLKFKNVSKAFFRIVSVNPDDLDEVESKYNHKQTLSFLSGQKVVKEWSQTLPDDGKMHFHNTELILPALSHGFYVVLVNTNGNFNAESMPCAYVEFQVSNLLFMTRNTTLGDFELKLFERKSGKQVPGATVKIFERVYNYTSRQYDKKLQKTLTTDEQGEITYQSTANYRNFSFEITKGNDRLHSENNFYSYRNQTYERSYTYTTFFTDRMIYRPGQSIYYKGLVVKKDTKNKSTPMPNTPGEVGLYDANNQKVSSTSFVTNEFSTFHGTFEIPLGLATGQYRITDGYNSHYISVEEYKRPKFEVKIEDPKVEFKLKDTIAVKGFAKALAGFAISKAKVSYRVVRKTILPDWYWSYKRYYYDVASNKSEEIVHGEMLTNEQGEFEVKFYAKPDLSVSADRFPTFNYSIEVSVTDESGETRDASSNIRLGYQSFEIDLSMGSELDIQSGPGFQVFTRTLNGEHVASDVKISFHRLKEKSVYYRKKLWAANDAFIIPEEEYHKKFPNDVYKNENDISTYEIEKTEWLTAVKTIAGESMKSIPMIKLPEGRYLVEANSTDKDGRPVKAQKIIKIYDRTQSRFAFQEEFWSAAPRQQFEPGETARIVLGSSARLTVNVEVEKGGEIVHRQQIMLNNEQKVFEYPVVEADRGNYVVNVYAVNEARSFSRSYLITVPYTNKQLDVKLITWRDKMLPGSQESWKMNVTPKLGEKKVAEMLLTMYDASLDAYVMNYWNLATDPTYYAVRLWQSYGERLAHAKQLYFHEKSAPSMRYINRYRLNWFGFNYSEGYYREDADMAGIRPASRGRATVTTAARDETAAVEESETISTPDALEKGNTGQGYANFKDKDKEESGIGGMNGDFFSDGDGKQALENQIRSNFAETAFFYPTLTTDEKGDVYFNFKMPESVTRWRFMGLALTKDLSQGYLEKEVITQKDLMINTFSPRFVRAGDELFFTAKVTNLTDREIAANTNLELFNALTSKNLNSEMENVTPGKTVKIAPGQSAKVEWKIRIPASGIDAVQYKVMATAGDMADGEEMIIPILSNRMLVTESLPLMIRGNQTKNFTFKSLSTAFESSTLTFERLTLEFTQNPAWYAIQALPYLMEYPHECAEQTFHRFYANAIATKIANSDPKIKKIFEVWRTVQPDALLSNLEKNEELKNVLLQESPWVREAKNESERKRRVAILFDLNRMSAEKESAFIKLKQMQSPNGGWPWFKGGPDDRYITQLILAGLGKLRKLGIQHNEAAYMIKHALHFCDKRLKDDFDQLVKNKADMKLRHIDHTQVQYFYIRSYFSEIGVSSEAKFAYEFFQNQAVQFWTQMNRYEQGMLALHFHRKQNSAQAMKIMASLKENSIQNEDLGMYWKGMLSSSYYWHESPIETMALLIEAFSEVSNDQASVEEMKIWLLRNKQTNDWKTTKATADACYALIMKGVQMLSTDNSMKIEMGNLTFDPDDDKNLKTEAGTGYFKTTIAPEKIQLTMSEVKVSKSSPGIAWGAVYLQYFEELNRIKSNTETPMKVSKKLFVQTKTDKGLVLTPIESGKGLAIGDKVIARIEISTDRPLEYVHLKDMRASCFEPENVLSTYKYQQGLGYYESTRDAATHFFISYMPRGFYVFEYPVRVTHAGVFSNGISSLQCMYAPEFAGHSEGMKITVK